jgi:DNA-binding FrmR family transcriptional regulator
MMSEHIEHIHLHKQRKAIINRLSRVEGHIRSIKQMVEQGRDCADILIQLSAVRSAIDKAGRVVLEDHLESCLFHVGVVPEESEIWSGIKEILDVFL